MAESTGKEKIIKYIISDRSIKVQDYVSESFLKGINSPLITLLCNGTVDLLFCFISNKHESERSFTKKIVMRKSLKNGDRELP